MQIDRPKHVIDDRTYEFQMLPPMRALAIIVRFGKILGAPLGKIVSSFGAGKDISIKGLAGLLDSEVNLSSLGESIPELMDRISEGITEETVTELLDNVWIKNNQGGFIKVHIDRDFSGKIKHMLKVIKKSLEVNFKDFLGELIDHQSLEADPATTPATII